MLELSQRREIGAVGIRLRYPDGTVAHEGMVCGRLGLASSVDQHLHVIKEMSAVSGACLMTRREVFEASNSIDEVFAHALWDVDYCLRIQKLGYRVLCTPLAEMTWGEAARVGGAGMDGRDARTFAKRWGGVDEIDDPYLNVNVLWPTPLSSSSRLSAAASLGTPPDSGHGAYTPTRRGQRPGTEAFVA